MKKRVNVQEKIDRKELKKTVDKHKYGRAASVDGRTAEMLKNGGTTSRMDVYKICDLA